MGGILDGKPSDGPKFMHSYTGEGAMQAIEEFQRNGRKDYKVTKLLLLMSDGPASDPIQASKAVSRTIFEIMYQKTYLQLTFLNLILSTKSWILWNVFEYRWKNAIL